MYHLRCVTLYINNENNAKIWDIVITCQNTLIEWKQIQKLRRRIIGFFQYLQEAILDDDQVVTYRNEMA